MKYDANWWQLYTSMEGAEEVAKVITTNLNETCRVACANMAEDDLHTARTAGTSVYSRMTTVLANYSEYGASDTEPRYMLRNWVNKKFNMEL